MPISNLFAILATLVLSLQAFPGATLPLKRATTALSTTEIDTWTDPAWYSSAAYCAPSSIATWSCGLACESLATPIQVLVTGGDDAATPYYYVLKTSSQIIVAVAGTNIDSASSIEDDINYFLTSPSEIYFPASSSSGVQVHEGFYGAFERMASDILSGVQTGVSSGTTDVLVVGHSLGGAIAHLTATYLQQLLGTSASVTLRAFASPRIGNPAWATYLDNTLGGNAEHMINYNDDVPHLPPEDWGFEASGGEVWINGHGGYELCSGQENPDCADSLASGWKEVLLFASFADDFDSTVHKGPYAGVTTIVDLGFKATETAVKAMSELCMSTFLADRVDRNTESPLITAHKHKQDEIAEID